MDHDEAENGEELNSPIEQVALTVPTTDDPSLPVFTFRVRVLGLLSCITLSFLNQFFSYRREPLTITAVSAQIAVLPIGRFMAAALPKRKYWLPWTRFQFCLNPGPFNLKEHVLITIFAGAGATTVTAIHIVNIVKIYHRRNLEIPVGLLIVITSQVIILHQQLLQSANKIQLGSPDGFLAFQWAAQIVIRRKRKNIEILYLSAH